MIIKVYGLKNCDTCRAALKWLKAEGRTVDFIDVRKDGVDRADVSRWANVVGWDVLLNKRGTTWRGLDAALKEDLTEDKAIDLILDHPALIKRPVFDVGDKVFVGFKDDQKISIQAL